MKVMNSKQHFSALFMHSHILFQFFPTVNICSHLCPRESIFGAHIRQFCANLPPPVPPPPPTVQLHRRHDALDTINNFEILNINISLLH